MNITTDWTENDWDSFGVWLKGMLQSTQGVVTFIKSDGSERVMKCTLSPELLPNVKVEVTEGKENKKPRKESTTSMRVFDLEKNEWRSFTIKKVTKVNFTIE